MKVKSIHLHFLRNNEIFQFHTEFGKLVKDLDPSKLKIEQLFDKYQVLYKDLDDAMLKISKSAITADITAADQRRDSIFRGMIDANKAALNHFDTEKTEAARRLQIVFDTYGNIARMTLNEQTAATYNLLQELNNKHAADIAAAGIADWVKELEKQNNAFGDLMRDRFDETAAKTSLKVRQVRTDIDSAYRNIVQGITGLAMVDGNGVYDEFINRLNAIVDKYNNNLAQSKRNKTEKTVSGQ